MVDWAQHINYLTGCIAVKRLFEVTGVKRPVAGIAARVQSSDYLEVVVVVVSFFI